MYLLDTNVISELRPGKAQASPAVLAWAASVPHNQHFISVVTVCEHEMGVLRMERRDPKQGEALRAWWNATRKAFGSRTLPYLEAEAMRCATLHVPDMMAFRDSMILATALVHGMTLVTRNEKDFQNATALAAGVQILNPWLDA
ncbi:type II toxin-antitoxin system VapC family toxin [Xenophilus azovorans]|uniref:type II toxin-antitoxin system VapC family toxin n=1 Tax=Xenophilus azovorans TaxID=151755 RepID=UPI00056EC77A